MEYKLGFVLGRESHLSIAEIMAVLERENVISKVYLCAPPILIVESNDANLLTISIDSLGGTIKIFEIVAQSSRNDIPGILATFPLPQKEKRVNFGISFYGMRGEKTLGSNLKKHFIESGLAARNVTGRFPDLSSVIVSENKLLERGFEAIVIKDKEQYLIGKTLAVQDYKAYSSRDYGRPSRDDRSGMLPPKLAKIMINLAKKDVTKSIYDPFCGSGTVLTEALVLGYKNLYGSDLGADSCSRTRSNLNWFEQFGYSKIENEKIFVSDVLTPNKLFKIDAIVSEGYLGEPVKKNEKEALLESEKLRHFYLSALKNFVKYLNHDGRIVIAIPFFIVKNKRLYLPIMEHLSSLGLSLVPFDSAVKLSERKTLTYARKDQFVGREILVLEPSK